MRAPSPAYRVPRARAPIDLAWDSLYRLGSPPGPAWLRGESFTAVAIGRFRKSKQGWSFSPSVPGPQSILVAGSPDLLEGGSPVALAPIPGGLSMALIDGESDVFFAER